VISGEQSKILNSLWTTNFFSNKDKTFFLKLYNNILGYNNAVAHFVRGDNPYCTFCNVTESPEQNYETPLHLFLDCPNVTTVVENIFKRITRDNDFDFSRKEYFTTFERHTFSCAKNRVLTIVSKIVKKIYLGLQNQILRSHRKPGNCMEFNALEICAGEPSRDFPRDV
jgi:hypothetical protein